MAIKKNIIFDTSLPLGELASKLYKEAKTDEQIIEICFYFVQLNELVVHSDFKKHSEIYYKQLFKSILGVEYNDIEIKL